jgi:hypothetical protein
VSNARPESTPLAVEDALALVRERAKKYKTSRALITEVQDWLKANWDASGEPYQHYHGDTTVKGNFLVGPENVVVSGDLVVGGCLQDGEQADHTFLVVLGSLRARDICTLSLIAVFGDVEVDGVVFGDSLGDEVLAVGGDLRATAVIANGHNVHVRGDVQATYLSGWHPVRAKARTSKPTHSMEEILVPGVFKDESIDLPKMVQSLLKGKAVLRKTTGSAKSRRPKK